MDRTATPSTSQNHREQENDTRRIPAGLLWQGTCAASAGSGTLSGVVTAIWRLRAAVLTLMGVLGVHQGRYLFATHEHEHALSHAHAYLTWLGPLAGALLFLAVVQFAANMHAGGDDSAALPRARSLWLAATGTLLVVFGVQESLETYFSHGHLTGLAGLLGAGGWTALPLALLAGGAIALGLRGAASVARWLLRRAERRARPLARTSIPCIPVLVPRSSVLARRLAGRAPPLLS